MKTSSMVELANLSQKLQSQGKTVGLLVGSFDVLHLGHIRLFRFAKTYVDFVMVGLDHDETIKLVKGKSRPINSFEQRREFLSDISTIDKVFLIENVSHHDSDAATANYLELLTHIKPTHVFTHTYCDRHWKKKKQIAEQLGILFIPDVSEKVTSSGAIVDALERDL